MENLYDDVIYEIARNSKDLTVVGTLPQLSRRFRIASQRGQYVKLGREYQERKEHVISRIKKWINDTVGDANEYCRIDFKDPHTGGTYEIHLDHRLNNIQIHQRDEIEYDDNWRETRMLDENFDIMLDRAARYSGVFRVIIRNTHPMYKLWFFFAKRMESVRAHGRIAPYDIFTIDMESVREELIEEELNKEYGLI